MNQTIPFTQYLRPNGRKADVFIARPDEIVSQAMAIIEAGHAFECEELMDGHVSLTVTGNDDDGDLDIEVCQNGPAVPIAVDALVSRVFKRIGGVK